MVFVVIVVVVVVVGLFLLLPWGRSPSSAERRMRAVGGAKDRLRRDSPQRCRSLRFWASSRGRRGGGAGSDVTDDKDMTTRVVVLVVVIVRGERAGAGIGDS